MGVNVESLYAYGYIDYVYGNDLDNIIDIDASVGATVFAGGGNDRVFVSGSIYENESTRPVELHGDAGQRHSHRRPR